MIMKFKSVDEALDFVNNPKTGAVKKGAGLAVTWQVIRPFIKGLEFLAGKKLKPYIDAFIAAIDKLAIV
jgi:hypothetical protein